MIPVFVNLQDKVTVDVDGRTVTGNVAAEELGIELADENGLIRFTEPFNHTMVGIDGSGLLAVTIIVSEHRVHVIGCYTIDKLAGMRCVTLCGTTVCGKRASIRFGKTTVSA